MDAIIGAVLGAGITGGVALYIHFTGRPKRSGIAYRVLAELHKKTETAQGEFFRTRSSNDDLEIAQHLYRSEAVEIIATAFHENPLEYGERDLLRLFQGRDFTRITSTNACPKESQQTARELLIQHHKGADLVVLPQDLPFVRIDGMFCRFRDNSYLCFLSFRNPSDASKNWGIVFRDDMAISFFEYYRDLCERHS